MAESIDALRAKAMASMVSTSSSSSPVNPNNPNNPNNPIPPGLYPKSTDSAPQIREDGGSSFPVDNLRTVKVTPPANPMQFKHFSIHAPAIQSENPKKGIMLSINTSSKLLPVQKRAASKNDYNKQNLKRLPFKSTWRAPCGSGDNLVISFSDDDTESESDDFKSEIGDKREENRNVGVEDIKSQRPLAASSMRTCIPSKASNINIPKQNHLHTNYTLPASKILQEKRSLAAGKNELQSQKHDSAAKVLTGNDQVNITDVLTDNKVFLHQGDPVKKIDLNKKYLNQRKRRISPVNKHTCGSLDLKTKSDAVICETHVESKIDGKYLKRLKIKESSQSKNTSDALKLPFSMSQPISKVQRKTSVNISSKCDTAYGCSKAGLLSQINLRKNICPDETNNTLSTSSEVLCEELPTYSNAVAITTENGLPYMQENRCTSIACISSNDDGLTHKAIIGSSTEYHKKTSNAEDGANCSKNPFPQNLRSFSNSLPVSHSKTLNNPQVEDVIMDKESLMRLEDCIDKELEEAQEHRRKCEREEIEALKAYRKAQMALMDANDRCSEAYSRREQFANQFRTFMMNLSSSSVSSVWHSKYGNTLDLVTHVPNADNVHYDSSYQHIDMHKLVSMQCIESDVQKLDPKLPCKRDGVLTSTPSQNDMLTEDNNQEMMLNVSTDSITVLHEGYRENLVHVDGKSEKECQTGNDYELEAALRSKLVSRLSQKIFAESISNRGNAQESFDYCKSNDITLNRIETIDSGKLDNQMPSPKRNYWKKNELLEEEKDKQSGLHKFDDDVMISHGQYSSATPMLNCESIPILDFEKTMHSLEELSSISHISDCPLPSSVLGIFSKHLKFMLPESSFSNEKVLGVYDAMEDTAEDCFNEHVCLLSKIIRIDSSTSYLAIDPFWPFCMFELRGKCNDEDCPWQHLRDTSHKIQKHTDYTLFDSGCQFSSLSTLSKPDDSPRASPSKYNENAASIPSYFIGSNLIKSVTHPSGSLLARSNWQFWENSFCTFFHSPFSVERLLLLDTPTLCDGNEHADDKYSNMLSLYIQSEDNNLIFHPLTDSEQSLELAIDLFTMENKLMARMKALLVLSRFLEANPNSVIHWIVYLHIFYRKEKEIGKDDMFLEAVHHNKGSYELWLMYINSRMQLDQRIKAYVNAINALCQMSCTINPDSGKLSSCILDLFLQMIDFLCMSGKVDVAISTANKILNPLTDGNSDCVVPPEIFSCLMVSDRCIFCICCVYLTMYRKLPEVVVQKLELIQDLPFEIVWPFVQLTIDKKSQAMELMQITLDKLDMVGGMEKACLQSIQEAHFLAVSHVKFFVAIEGLNSCNDLLAKYMSRYPTCVELISLSSHCLKHLKNESTFDLFERALHNWPKHITGVQCLWNQYAEHILDCKNMGAVKDLMDRWFCCFCKVKDLESADYIKHGLASPADLPSLLLDCGGFHYNQDDITFGFLNLFLYELLQNDTVKAQLALNEALKHSPPDCFNHCIREYAAFLLSRSVSILPIRRTLGHPTGYLRDPRYPVILSPLSRNIFKKIKKPRLRQMIDKLLGPVSRNCSLLNLVLQDCYGPSLLPENFDEPKILVDYTESLLELSPTNYALAISVHKVSSRDFKSSGVLFWASSLLVNSIIQAFPVAPEQVWIEAFNLLRTLDFPGIDERFLSHGLQIYPFSVKLWQSYYDLSKVNGEAISVLKSATEKGIHVV